LYIQPLCSGEWHKISDNTASVSVDGGEVALGVDYTFGRKHPILTDGKPSEINVTCRVLYTEANDEATELVRAVYERDCSERGLCVRWIPRGATAGNKQYTTVSGIVLKPVYPGGEAGEAALTGTEFSVTCTHVLTEDVV